MPYKDPEKAREYSRAARKRFRERHPEREAANARKWRLKAYYGLTPERYDEILAAQQGKCPICEGSITSRNQAIDHCHETLAVWAILCKNCNAAVGLLAGSPERIERALEYLTTRTPVSYGEQQPDWVRQCA